MPSYTVGSNVFPVNDRVKDEWRTDYNDHFHGYPSESITRTVSSIPSVSNTKTNLPFLDQNVEKTTDYRTFYKHYGDAYRPENLSKASKTDSQHTDVYFGYAEKSFATDSRDHFTVHPLPPQKTREQRVSEIVATRTGKSVVKSLGYDPVKYVSVMEEGNQHMVENSHGTVAKQEAVKVSRTTAIRLGTSGPTTRTDYSDHFTDYRADKSSEENPYHYNNRVHEVDPSSWSGRDGSPQKESRVLTTANGTLINSMTVVGTDGEFKEIPCVKSSIDFGHDDYVLQSQYMASSNADNVTLTRVGGWHTHVKAYVPPIRVKFASNANHPAVLRAKEMNTTNSTL